MNWRLLCRVIDKFGAEHQKNKAIEEMGELITAIAREQDCRVTTRDVITEIADVQIMLHQLTLIYGPELVDKEIKAKLDRLEKRLNHG